MTLKWTRVAARGFVRSHWITTSPTGIEISIWRRVTKYGRNGPNIVKLLLIPGHTVHEDLKAAKAAAELIDPPKTKPVNCPTVEDMAFRMQISCENDAFQEGNIVFELIRILEETASRLRNGEDFSKHRNILDANGNVVGTAKLAPRSLL